MNAKWNDDFNEIILDIVLFISDTNDSVNSECFSCVKNEHTFFDTKQRKKKIQRGIVRLFLFKRDKKYIHINVAFFYLI